MHLAFKSISLMTTVQKGMDAPPSLVASLKDALKNRQNEGHHGMSGSSYQEGNVSDERREHPYTRDHASLRYVRSMDEHEGIRGKSMDDDRPAVLITNDDGIHAEGLRALVEALVNSDCCHVLVCAPDCNKSGVGHSVTLKKTVEVGSVDMKGAIAYEISGTPADCVSLSLSGMLFPQKKISLVLSGINKGANSGYHIIYSGTVAGAREALMRGVPAISFSLNWKRGESNDADFQVAASLCLPLIKAALRHTTEGFTSKGLFLNVDIPTNPLKTKGFKVTRQGTSRLAAKWCLVSPKKSLSGAGPCKENAIGVRLAQLGLAASAVGAARRMNSHLKNTEIESVAGPENGSEPEPLVSQKKLYFLRDTEETEIGDESSVFDFGALQEGYVTITPLGLLTEMGLENFDWVAQWISTAVELGTSSAL